MTGEAPVPKAREMSLSSGGVRSLGRVGFGVGTPEQAATIGAYADGVVVGSAIVDRIEAASSKASAVEDVAAFIRDLKAALRR